MKKRNLITDSHPIGNHPKRLQYAKWVPFSGRTNRDHREIGSRDCSCRTCGVNHNR